MQCVCLQMNSLGALRSSCVHDRCSLTRPLRIQQDVSTLHQSAKGRLPGMPKMSLPSAKNILDLERWYAAFRVQKSIAEYLSTCASSKGLFLVSQSRSELITMATMHAIPSIPPDSHRISLCWMWILLRCRFNSLDAPKHLITTSPAK